MNIVLIVIACVIGYLFIGLLFTCVLHRVKSAISGFGNWTPKSDLERGNITIFWPLALMFFIIFEGMALFGNGAVSFVKFLGRLSAICARKNNND